MVAIIDLKLQSEQVKYWSPSQLLRSFFPIFLLHLVTSTLVKRLRPYSLALTSTESLQHIQLKLYLSGCNLVVGGLGWAVHPYILGLIPTKSSPKLPDTWFW